MTDRWITIVLNDGFGRAQTNVTTELSAQQLMDKILEWLDDGDVV